MMHALWKTNEVCVYQHGDMSVSLHDKKPDTKQYMQYDACDGFKNTEQMYIAQHTPMWTEMRIKGSVRITLFGQYYGGGD